MYWNPIITTLTTTTWGVKFCVLISFLTNIVVNIQETILWTKIYILLSFHNYLITKDWTLQRWEIFLHICLLFLFFPKTSIIYLTLLNKLTFTSHDIVELQNYALIKALHMMTNTLPTCATREEVYAHLSTGVLVDDGKVVIYSHIAYYCFMKFGSYTNCSYDEKNTWKCIQNYSYLIISRIKFYKILGLDYNESAIIKHQINFAFKKY